MSNILPFKFFKQLVKTKTEQFGISYFSAKHTALRSKSKNWLARY